ncbi:class I SAM-dependent methyltransferase [Sulfurovum lithotrophicum]|uniref:class I SAM-dependent methyltransferase n=1 Tax=Sulfurovum lithotrophicum TaxID=206403 RepID=UPI001FE05516|nr:class I SAM-dependent methyltransferase [Sulfurovum lithotrophicum]
MNKDDTPEEAEKNVVDYFFRYLYKAPAKVLVVGTGLDLLPKRLMEKGFEYTGISKDKTVIKKSKKRFPDAEFLHTDLKELETETKYDIIIFRESADQGSFSSLFEKAGSLLTEGGEDSGDGYLFREQTKPAQYEKICKYGKKRGFCIKPCRRSFFPDFTRYRIQKISYSYIP